MVHGKKLYFLLSSPCRLYADCLIFCITQDLFLYGIVRRDSLGAQSSKPDTFPLSSDCASHAICIDPASGNSGRRQYVDLNTMAHLAN